MEGTIISEVHHLCYFENKILVCFSFYIENLVCNSKECDYFNDCDQIWGVLYKRSSKILLRVFKIFIFVLNFNMLFHKCAIKTIYSLGLINIEHTYVDVIVKSNWGVIKFKFLDLCLHSMIECMQQNFEKMEITNGKMI
jgi:hypothetical protein